MGKGIIGKKLGMTQIFQDNGTVVSVTVIKAGPCVVIQKKTEEKDGYNALQLGFEDAKKSKINKPLQGHFNKHDVDPKKYIKEFRNISEEIDEGSEISVEAFTEGELVNITGISKGKGFAGNVKRWGHNTGPKTHGSHSYRAPGSIGATDASRVFKGQKLPGRMGNEQVTVKNLEIVKIDKDKNLLMIKGSVPGPKKGILTIKTVDR